MPALTDPQGSAIVRAAATLMEAAASRIPCRPVRDWLPAGDITTAYTVQSRIVDARLADGARLAGRKIGLTNPKVQAQLGVDQPDFGVLLEDMACRQNEPVDIHRLLQPRIEAELAFVLIRDLDQPGRITDVEVAAATGWVCAALEIVDSRIASWDISIVDTIADNASSGLYILGDQQVPLAGIDVVAIEMTLRAEDGAMVSAGTGADCLGSPLNAVAWLANTVRDHGAPLRAGEVILSGALGPMTAVTPGSAFTADITGVGTVSARFTGGTP